MYIAYNKMFFKGKAIGRAFATNSGKNMAAVIVKNKKDNIHWNKWQKNKSYKVKFSHVRKK